MRLKQKRCLKCGRRDLQRRASIWKCRKCGFWWSPGWGEKIFDESVFVYSDPELSYSFKFAAKGSLYVRDL